MKKQTFARKLFILLLIVPLPFLTVFITYRIDLAQNERDAKQDEFEELVWSIYQEHAFHGNELPNYEYELYGSYYCSCPCPDTEKDSIQVRYYDKHNDTLVTGQLFVAYPFRDLFEKKVKSPNKYLVVKTSKTDYYAYADEFSPVPLYVDLRTKTVVLKGKKGNMLYITVESHQTIHAIVEHIEKYIPSDIPIL